ncbi:MAG TPA: FAD-binding protein [Bacteroidia bacterium]|nr:FAD-binding protein [Bacteroidia bacterium]
MKLLELFLLPEEAANEQEVKRKIFQKEKNFSSYRIIKRSIDARSSTVKIRLLTEVFNAEEKIPEQNFSRDYKNVSNANPVLIIGCGPAGMFAALRLIELGFKPVIIERGKNVRERRRDLADINKKSIIHPDSNYCFGEGGAGTYSDGKLYTRSTKRGDINRILRTFIEHGAENDIAIDAHPHIGTNKLPQIITSMREKIIECGGEIHFHTKLKEFIISSNEIKGIKVSESNSVREDSFGENLTSFFADAVILATGHSARDIFYLLQKQNILIEPQPLAIGVRIEHPQKIIDAAQYHCSTRNKFLPPASYSMAQQVNGKGVYSFCMCPGGIIAPAATDVNEIVVNGWSPSKRNNPFANSGMVASVEDKDVAQFEKAGALKFLAYQKQIEQTAFKAGGNNLQAPAQRMIDFVENKFSSSLPPCSYIPGINSVKLDTVLPKEISTALREGLKAFGKKMPARHGGKGYYTNEAVLVGVESRTSSPVRIPRDKETLMHPGIKGLFPCGEGAGYAGGIVSAAMDGERCADMVKLLK